VYESLILDSARHEVHANDHEIDLTPKEFGLLEYFLGNPGYVLSRDALLNAVWEYDYFGTTRTVDVHADDSNGKSRCSNQPSSVFARSDIRCGRVWAPFSECSLSALALHQYSIVPLPFYTVFEIPEIYTSMRADV